MLSFPLGVVGGVDQRGVERLGFHVSRSILNRSVGQHSVAVQQKEPIIRDASMNRPTKRRAFHAGMLRFFVPPDSIRS